MAEEVWTILMKDDLDCHRCKKKIQRTICKLQEKVKILRISYDQKNGIVTIAGPFDRERVLKKLKDEAGKVIKSIKIEEEQVTPKAEKVPDMNVPVHFNDRSWTEWTDINGLVGKSRCRRCCFCCP